MDSYTKISEGDFRKMMKPNKPNELKKIFKNINATKSIKYSSSQKEVEYITE